MGPGKRKMERSFGNRRVWCTALLTRTVLKRTSRISGAFCTDSAGRPVKAKWSWSLMADSIGYRLTTNQRDDVMAKKVIETGKPARRIEASGKPQRRIDPKEFA